MNGLMNGLMNDLIDFDFSDTCLSKSETHCVIQKSRAIYSVVSDATSCFLEG